MMIEKKYDKIRCKRKDNLYKMYCTNCGKENAPGTRFCVFCGRKLESEESEKKGKLDLNYYEILEITPEASEEVIKAAYKALVKKYHPDNGEDISNDKITITDINVAYETLSDPQKRKVYDQNLNLARKAEKEEQSEKTETVNNEYQYQKAQTTTDVTETDGESIATGIGFLVAFVLLNYFNFNIWFLLISGAGCAYSVGNLISGLCISTIKNQSTDEKTMRWLKIKEEDIKMTFQLFFGELLFCYLQIDNWFTRFYLFAFIVYFVIVIKSVIELHIQKNR